MAKPDGPTSQDSREWQVCLCLEGLDRRLELERAVQNAGFRATVVRDARRLAASGESAIPVVVVLSDAVDGWLRIVADLHRARPRVRIFLITALDDRLELVAALSAGVDGIGRPDDSPEAIVRSIVALCEEGASLPRGLVKALVGEVRVSRGHAVRSVNGTVRVTDREWQVLHLMLQGRTTKEMAAELFVAVGTVRSHVSAVLGKLGVSSRYEAVALLERHDPATPDLVTRVLRK